MRLTFIIWTLIWSTAAAAQEPVIVRRSCGELCVLDQAIADLKAMPPRPSSDPIQTSLLSNVLDNYIGCNIDSSKPKELDWSNASNEIDMIFEKSFQNCASARKSVVQITQRDLRVGSKRITADQEKIYTDLLLGTVFFDTLVKSFKAEKAPPEFLSYVFNVIDPGELKLVVDYFRKAEDAPNP